MAKQIREEQYGVLRFESKDKFSKWEVKVDFNLTKLFLGHLVTKALCGSIHASSFSQRFGSHPLPTLSDSKESSQ